MSERSCVKQLSPVTARQQASSPFICPSVPPSSLSVAASFSSHARSSVICGCHLPPQSSSRGCFGRGGWWWRPAAGTCLLMLIYWLLHCLPPSRRPSPPTCSGGAEAGGVHAASHAPASCLGFPVLLNTCNVNLFACVCAPTCVQTSEY